MTPPTPSPADPAGRASTVPPVTAGSDAPVAASYEQALAELERLVADLESGKLELEASLAAYQRGSALLRFCQGQLSLAEQQVRVLEGETLVEVAQDDGQD